MGQLLPYILATLCAFCFLEMSRSSGRDIQAELNVSQLIMVTVFFGCGAPSRHEDVDEQVIAAERICGYQSFRVF